MSVCMCVHIFGGGMNEEELEAAASKITEGNVRRLPGTTMMLLLWDKDRFGNFMNAIGILLARDPNVGPWNPS